MSSFSSKSQPECRPWHAPNLDVAEESVFDYKLTDVEKITHREQQQNIRQQAYEKSFAKGYMEGLEKGRVEMKSQAAQLNALMSSLVMPLPEFDTQLVSELAELSMMVVKKLVRRELKTSPDEIIAVINEAVSLLPDVTADVILELHPEDALLVRNILVEPGAELQWSIVTDPMLTRGGCRVLTRSSRIDATVETRLNAIIATVLGDERKQV